MEMPAISANQEFLPIRHDIRLSNAHTPAADNGLHNGCNRRTNSDAPLAVISSRSVARVIAT